jgi:hypothetical protein
MEGLISGVIAFLGVLISVIVSFWTSNRNIKTELKKINTQIEQNFAQKLIEARLLVYPNIYKTVNSFIKIIETRTPEKEIVERFYEDFINHISESALLFGGETDNMSYDIRKAIYKVIQNEDELKRDEIWKSIRFLLQGFEIALKKDIGVYVVDFSDAERKLNIKTYSSIAEIVSKSKDK